MSAFVFIIKKANDTQFWNTKPLNSQLPPSEFKTSDIKDAGVQHLKQDYTKKNNAINQNYDAAVQQTPSIAQQAKNIFSNIVFNTTGLPSHKQIVKSLVQTGKLPQWVAPAVNNLIPDNAQAKVVNNVSKAVDWDKANTILFHPNLSTVNIDPSTLLRLRSTLANPTMYKKLIENITPQNYLIVQKNLQLLQNMYHNPNSDDQSLAPAAIALLQHRNNLFNDPSIKDHSPWFQDAYSHIGATNNYKFKNETYNKKITKLNQKYAKDLTSKVLSSPGYFHYAAAMWMKRQGWKNIADFAKDPMRFWLSVGALGLGAVGIGGALLSGNKNQQQPQVASSNTRPILNRDMFALDYRG